MLAFEASSEAERKVNGSTTDQDGMTRFVELGYVVRQSIGTAIDKMVCSEDSTHPTWPPWLSIAPTRFQPLGEPLLLSEPPFRLLGLIPSWLSRSLRIASKL
jgi:hypothetical protein